MRYEWKVTELDTWGTVRTDLVDNLTGETLHSATATTRGIVPLILPQPTDDAQAALGGLKQLTPPTGGASKAFVNSIGQLIQPVSATTSYINGELYEKLGTSGSWVKVPEQAGPLEVTPWLVIGLTLIAAGFLISILGKK